jgi:hypothetical protein
MKTVFFLLLRLICYPALAIVVAAGIALIVVWVNGQCSPVSEIGMTCATKFSQRVADFGFGVAGIVLDDGYPIVLAVGGLIFLIRDVRRKTNRMSSNQAPS